MRLSFIILVLFALPLHADEGKQLSPRPDASGLRRAERKVKLAYGSSVKTARSSSQKSVLAKEMLKVALETSKHDPERFVLCQEARKVAIAGGDKATAFKASIAIAEWFKPDGVVDGKEQFEKAEDLWEDAEKVGRKAQLCKRAEAIEWYAYAKPSAEGLDKIIIEKRLSYGFVVIQNATLGVPNLSGHSRDVKDELQDRAIDKGIFVFRVDEIFPPGAGSYYRGGEKDKVKTLTVDFIVDGETYHRSATFGQTIKLTTDDK